MTPVDEKVSFNLILHAGNATNLANEAIQVAQDGDFTKADEKIKLASEELVSAHKVQTDLLVDLANGVDVDVSILTVHAQDHLTSASLTINFAKQIIRLEKNIMSLKARL